jgi:two-component system sensor histidine kinase RegB
MGPRGSDDTLVRYAPLASVVEEAAAPHAERGIGIVIRVEGVPLERAGAQQPLVSRSPEIIQGLRNLVQNAVDFARATVWIDLDWTETEVRAVIGDDGPGYPQDLIGRIGDPFVRRRGPAPGERPGYEGMGLGLFIAKTLLERSGASLRFDNGGAEPAGLAADFARPTGAIVTVVWPRERVAPERDAGPSAAVPAASGREGANWARTDR